MPPAALMPFGVICRWIWLAAVPRQAMQTCEVGDESKSAREEGARVLQTREAHKGGTWCAFPLTPWCVSGQVGIAVRALRVSRAIMRLDRYRRALSSKCMTV